MDFDFSPDQALLAEALEKWSAGHRDIPAESRLQPWLDGGMLAAELAELGFFEVAVTQGLGLLGAVQLIEAVGRTPYAVEIGACALVVPSLGVSGLSGPVAMLRAGGRGTARFLQAGGSALVDCGSYVSLLECRDCVEPVKSAYAYPVGRYCGDFVADAGRLESVEVARFRQLRTLAITAEALAAMEAALALAVDHVTSRVQFGRPIGSFQAVQHRLAECSAIISATRWLLYRAASEAELEGGDHSGDAAIVAHDAAKRVIYETTQFHGALGLTLEYPLHLWTYRLRALQFDLARVVEDAPR